MRVPVFVAWGLLLAPLLAADSASPSEIDGGSSVELSADARAALAGLGAEGHRILAVLEGHHQKAALPGSGEVTSLLEVSSSSDSKDPTAAQCVMKLKQATKELKTQDRKLSE